jgi:TolA-binding protein
MPRLNFDNKWFILFAAAVLVVLAFLMLNFITPNAATILKKGRQDFDRGNFALARERFIEVLAMTEGEQKSGPRCEAMIFYATTFVRENRFEEAAREFRRFIQEYPDSFWTPQAYFDLAYCETMLGNRHTAYYIYQDIIVKFPMTSWAQYSKDRLKEFEDIIK